MGKGKRKGNKGKRRGDGIPPPAPPAGADDRGRQADEVAMLRAINDRIIAELVETWARLSKQYSPVADDGVQQHQHQRDDGEVVLPGDVEEPRLHGATKEAAVQERPDVKPDAVSFLAGKGAISEQADVAALPAVRSEASDAVSAVVDGEESEEESPEEEEKHKSGEPIREQSLEMQAKAAGLPADADADVVAPREVHVAAATDYDDDDEDGASLRARLAAAEEMAARLEAANAEKLQALERLGAKEAEAKATAERVVELEKQLGEMDLSPDLHSEGTVSTGTQPPAAATRDLGKQKMEKTPAAARGRRAGKTEKPDQAAAPAARHGGKVEGTGQAAGAILDAGQAHGGRRRRTRFPNTRYPTDTYVFYDAARVGLGQPSDASS